MRNSKRTDTSQSLTIVVKLGTSSIVSETTFQPKLSVLSSIAESICELRAQGHKVVLVSSGAIGMGLKRMKMSKRPKALADKQASHGLPSRCAANCSRPWLRLVKAA
jgi:glutamate 5-kinase